MDENEMGVAVEKNHYDPKIFGCPQYQLSVREDLKETIKNHEDVIEKLKKEMEKLKEENNELKSKVVSLSAPWEFDQVYRMCNPTSQCHFSDKTLEKSIKLYYKLGGTAYNYLRTQMKMPLPSKTTIARHMRKITFKPGISNDMLQLISLKAETMKEQDKQYGLVIDEMSTNPKLDWDPTAGEFVGHPTVPPGPNLAKTRENEKINPDDILACHIFNVMMVGLLASFKQLIAFHHTDRSWCPKFIAKWLKDLIMELQKIGLKCRFITMDQGKQNLAL